MNKQRNDAGKFWIRIITVVVVLFITATVTSIVIAKKRGSRVVDTEYYSHGLHYAERHDTSGNTGNKWTMTPTADGTFIQTTVRDEHGAPLCGGEATCTLDQNSTVPSGTMLHLTESSPGVYRVSRPTTVQGEMRGTIRVAKGNGVISGRVVIFN